MTKQEKIQEAYGEYWEQVKDYVNENGWTQKVSLLNRKECNAKRNLNSLNSNLFRPKSLQGIENNNGWIKIESEADLPKENTTCHFITKRNINYIGEFRKEEGESFFFKGIEGFSFSFITHYQPITKPNPPIY